MPIKLPHYIQAIGRQIATGLLLQFCFIGLLAASDGDDRKKSPPTSDPKQAAVVVVSGTIKGDDGAPIPGANVVEKGTMNGISTDTKGQFKLAVASEKSVLVISYIGYKSQDVLVGTQKTINVTLVSENQALEEVVVVGYGTQRKESVVGAITQVDNKQLMRSGTSNITNAIAGKLSGVLTMQSSGEPGNDHSEIIIRGLSSWNGSQPLIMVDGVERDFKDMDPNEIATISVLKDASATAVFGAKGANGVVIVTTKRGTLGKPKLDFTASYGISKATRIPAHISSHQTMTMYNQALMNGQQFTDLDSAVCSGSNTKTPRPP